MILYGQYIEGCVAGIYDEYHDIPKDSRTGYREVICLLRKE